MNDGQNTTIELEVEEEQERTNRMDQTFSRSRDSGREIEGPSGQEAPSWSPRPGQYSEKDEHHFQGRPRPRVPTPLQVNLLESQLHQAFKNGSPQEVWEISHTLVGMAREAVVEAARARFEANFGTRQCLTCDGLKVRPGVVATCAQVKQCYYTSIIGDPEKLSRVAESLSERKS